MVKVIDRADAERLREEARRDHVRALRMAIRAAHLRGATEGELARLEARLAEELPDE